MRIATAFLVSALPLVTCLPIEGGGIIDKITPCLCEILLSQPERHVETNLLSKYCTQFPPGSCNSDASLLVRSELEEEKERQPDSIADLVVDFLHLPRLGHISRASYVEERDLRSGLNALFAQIVSSINFSLPSTPTEESELEKRNKVDELIAHLSPTDLLTVAEAIAASLNARLGEEDDLERRDLESRLQALFGDKFSNLISGIPARSIENSVLEQRTWVDDVLALVSESDTLPVLAPIVVAKSNDGSMVRERNWADEVVALLSKTDLLPVVAPIVVSLIARSGEEGSLGTRDFESQLDALFGDIFISLAADISARSIKESKSRREGPVSYGEGSELVELISGYVEPPLLETLDQLLKPAIAIARSTEDGLKNGNDVVEPLITEPSRDVGISSSQDRILQVGASILDDLSVSSILARTTGDNLEVKRTSLDDILKVIDQLGPLLAPLIKGLESSSST